jgi:hypothetical protein
MIGDKVSISTDAKKINVAQGSDDIVGKTTSIQENDKINHHRSSAQEHSPG